MLRSNSVILPDFLPGRGVGVFPDSWPESLQPHGDALYGACGGGSDLAAATQGDVMTLATPFGMDHMDQKRKINRIEVDIAHWRKRDPMSGSIPFERCPVSSRTGTICAFRNVLARPACRHHLPTPAGLDRNIGAPSHRLRRHPQPGIGRYLDIAANLQSRGN